MRPESAAPPVVVTSSGDAPVVFDSPHSGTVWPTDVAPSAARADLLTMWDAFVDDLLADVPQAGATLIAAQFPRGYIDVNRAADDIDPELLAEPWPTALTVTDYTRRGMGLVRRYALPGVPMYDRKLTVAEVQARLDRYYFPYRRALRERLDALAARHGAVWHFDCHSMKSRGNAMNVDRGADRPDFVVSDRLGTSSDPAFTRWVADFFAGRGRAVKVNDPYRGGDLVRTFGAPAQRRHSVQIEINRALYMDEQAFAPHEGFAAVRRDLADFAAAVVARIRTSGTAGA
jgi:N-formylglutamate deformylase